jgi:flagellar biosynthesis protein FlhA
VKAAQDQGFYPVILCSEAARPLVKTGTSRDFPEMVVLSVPEIIPEVKVESVGEINIKQGVA